MRPAARLALVLLPLVSVLACGGRFDGNVPDAGGSSSSSGGSSGGGSGGSSGGSGSSSGGQGCPAPANVTNGVACSPDGITCLSAETITDCNGNASPIDCDCQGGQWFCDGPGPGPCPQPVCPQAQQVVPNTSCSVSSQLTCASATPYYDCNGNVAGDLQCNCNSDQWFCPEPDVICPTDGGAGCPPPASIQSGEGCNDYNTTCPGNPTQCNGQTDYDAFQCDNGVWVDVAQTTCDVDAGAGG